MEVREEMMEILEKVWIKLQGLPEAHSLELGAFCILLLFVGELLQRGNPSRGIRKERRRSYLIDKCIFSLIYLLCFKFFKPQSQILP